jgi:flagellar biosynthesis regulator FlaF
MYILLYTILASLPCLSASECIETKALIAGYVMLLTEANTPAAHIILKKEELKFQYRVWSKIILVNKMNSKDNTT